MIPRPSKCRNPLLKGEPGTIFNGVEFNNIHVEAAGVASFLPMELEDRLESELKFKMNVQFKYKWCY